MSEPRPRTESELVELVRSIDAPAPDALHREVRALVSTRQIVAPRAGRLVLARGPLAATALAAVLAAVLAIALSAGGNHATLSLREASAPTLRPATAAAPPESPSNDGQLAAAVDGVSFPYWEERF